MIATTTATANHLSCNRKDIGVGRGRDQRNGFVLLRMYNYFVAEHRTAQE
jgi:alkanesulfonate monooxygenase SsuD/methylene tetrahydromethanopterin reductase-like flavin-dependent oxidoreductase (luciferase family)